ncbi:phosphoadenosine phosphosulfate reductase domain-containing protein [Selenomonas ruminantium]|uniref:phosphoadenosine phosphosulfate reductase domain-containing protein n=1 Tax=Selenomonas ruminantium TaxID=971 RepID=UPI001C40904C|nr:phosphoadenosine phosphosulfate reductase family protein [Selenomonas ruminantium]
MNELYKYIWDKETGGVLLLPEQEKMSMEARPVYYQELDLLGFDKYYNYPRVEEQPIMWAENNNYFYRGEKIAKTQGGTLYSKPELIVLDNLGEKTRTLEPVNLSLMIEKNKTILENLTQETIKNVFNYYKKYKRKVDVFYVAFSGGKDSIVAADIVTKSLPNDSYFILFGDTQMEFVDTYDLVNHMEDEYKSKGIKFYRAKSEITPQESWRCFGPPSTAIRWCCSVHKTSPQLNLIRKIIRKDSFTGMAFTGVRAEESLKRSMYDDLTEGKKHQGQYSCHTILDWNSVEVFLYIYTNNLPLNNAYKKGSSRAGCLVCPNSTGKHEYIKRELYQKDVDKFLSIISETSGKKYNENEMKRFIDNGFWRTRKSGRELNLGKDMFDVQDDDGSLIVNVYITELFWLEWIKTIGTVNQVSSNEYRILFKNKEYVILCEKQTDKIIFKIPMYENTRDFIKLKSLFRSVIIKSIYCKRCGICEAECKLHCIDMSKGVKVSAACVHCFKCHDIRDHCMLYSSVKNKNVEGKKMSGLDRYFTFGTREEWIDTYLNYEGGDEFWMSDGDGIVQNKKKDAFVHFLRDANMVEYKRNADGDKYTKNIPTDFTKKLIKVKDDSDTLWGLIVSNLVYTPTFKWVIDRLNLDRTYSPEEMKEMLAEDMENDTKGLGRRNVVDALKVILAKTPLGTSQILGIVDADVKITASGNEILKLNSFTRTTWSNPSDIVILYSLYKFAEACDGMYQFSLESLLDDTIERDGISPTRIFGLDRETMIPILNGLSANYPAFISATFTLDLDQIALRSEKKAEDVLDLL